MAVGILEESLACAVTKELLDKDDAAQILVAAQSGELSRYLLENGVRLDLPLAGTHPVDPTRCSERGLRFTSSMCHLSHLYYNQTLYFKHYFHICAFI